MWYIYHETYYIRPNGSVPPPYPVNIVFRQNDDKSVKQPPPYLNGTPGGAQTGGNQREPTSRYSATVTQTLEKNLRVLEKQKPNWKKRNENQARNRSIS
jgi:hypothetical protein